VVGVLGFVVFKIRFAPLTVISASVTSGPVAAEVMGTGTLEARVQASISPKLQGRLVAVWVDQNDPVTTGQLLVSLDDSEWKQQVAMAQADLDAAQATVERVRAEEARSKAVLQRAQLDHDRAVDLRRADIAAQADLDKALENLRVAEADLRRAQAAIVEGERQRVVAEKTLLYHQARLADTRLLSPLDGLVVRRDRDPGDVAVPGNTILQLVATNELWISAWVDETAMAKLAIGQPARVVFRSEANRDFPGQVVRLGREADRETREFLVDVRVEDLPDNWAVGQRAEIYIQTDVRPAALSIPQAFVFWREGRPGVYVDAGGRARWRAIRPGLVGGNRVEVLGGLQPDEKVVRPAVPRRQPMRDGTPVRAS